MILLKIFVYFCEMVIVEKFEVIVDFGFDNSCMKDFFDFWFIFISFEDVLEIIVKVI